MPQMPLTLKQVHARVLSRWQGKMISTSGASPQTHNIFIEHISSTVDVLTPGRRQWGCCNAFPACLTCQDFPMPQMPLTLKQVYARVLSSRS